MLFGAWGVSVQGFESLGLGDLHAAQVMVTTHSKPFLAQSRHLVPDFCRDSGRQGETERERERERTREGQRERERERERRNMRHLLEDPEPCI